MNNNVFVDIKRFAEIYGCSVRYAQKLCREGKAPRHYKIGRQIRFRESDIVEWLESHVVNPENK